MTILQNESTVTGRIWRKWEGRNDDCGVIVGVKYAEIGLDYSTLTH